MTGAAFPMAVDLAILRLGFDRVAVLVEMTEILAVTFMRPRFILPRRMVHAVVALRQGRFLRSDAENRQHYQQQALHIEPLNPTSLDRWADRLTC
jgi:hypothetical protein